MKTLTLLAVSFIVGFSLFSEVLSLPSSFELSQSRLFRRSLDFTRGWLSKRSPAPHGSLCLLSGRSVFETRSTASPQSDDDDHSCTKSTDSSETNDSDDSNPSPSTRKFSHKSAGQSASAHSPSRKASKAKSSHSFSQRSSKYTHYDNKSRKKSGYHHSLKNKPHHFYQKFPPAASYASVKNTKSTENSGGSSMKESGSSVKYHGSLLKHKYHKTTDDSGESSAKETGNSEKYKESPHYGSPMKHNGNHVKSTDGSMVNNETPANIAASGTNDTGSPVNNPGSTVTDAENALNNPGDVMSNPGNTAQDTSLDTVNGGYQGKATFFYQGGNPGACGKVHEDSAFIVAIQTAMFDGGKHCGKTVSITRKSTGKNIKAKAADECPGCPTQQSLDLSVGAFNALGSPDEGVFDIEWAIID